MNQYKMITEEMDEYKSVEYIKKVDGNCKNQDVCKFCFFQQVETKYGRKDCYIEHMLYKKFANRDIEFSMSIEKFWIADHYNDIKIKRLLEILK